VKSKDQQLLEEAYDQVSSAKILRKATKKELNAIKKYCKEEVSKKRLRFDTTKLDFSEGWVWDLTEKDDVRAYISIKDNRPPSKFDGMKGYTTFVLVKEEGIFWLGQTDLQGKAKAETIEYHNLTKQHPELEGIF